MAALTKVVQVVNIFTDLDALAFREASPIDMSTALEAGVLVTVAHADTDANADGVEVFIEGRFGATDDYWSTLYAIRMGAGQATETTLDGEATLGGGTIPVDTTAGFTVKGAKYFIYEDAAPQNSEIITLSTHTTDTSLEALDALVRTHASGKNMYNLVASKYFPLPNALKTARVILNNDDADANMVYRVDKVLITGIA